MKDLGEIASEAVCFVLEAARDRIQSHPDDGFKWRQQHLAREYDSDCIIKESKEWTCLVKKECNDRWWPCRNGLWEAKRAEERRRVEEGREERKDSKEVELRNEEKFCRVEVVPVTKFMGENSFNFLWLRLLDQGVKDDNVLALPEI